MQQDVIKQQILVLLGSIDKKRLESLLAERTQRVGQVFASELPAEAINPTLREFFFAYIQLAPEIVNDLKRLAEKMNLEPIIEGYVRLAGNYLSSSCQELSQIDSENAEKDQRGQEEDLRVFLSLLQGAYIFNRMVEELNDQVESFIGIPLCEQDLMTANLIVHDMIEDRFANRLDQVVTSLFTRSKITKTLIEAELNKMLIDDYRHDQKALTGKPVRCFAEKFKLSMLGSLL